MNNESSPSDFQFRKEIAFSASLEIGYREDFLDIFLEDGAFCLVSMFVFQKVKIFVHQEQVEDECYASSTPRSD